MHQQARDFVAEQAALIGHRVSVVEFGSHNVNGSAREIVSADRWWGIDIWPGPCVDEIANAATWEPHNAFIDTIICMECLEHAPEAKEIVFNAFRALAPGGVFIMTCGGPDRMPHSCAGSLSIGDEFYRNISRDEMAEWLEEAGFCEFMVTHHDSVCEKKGPLADTYAIAWK